MRSALGIVLALALVALAASHVVIVGGLLRRRELGRAALAAVVPPLAPLWALECGMRAAAWTWLASFVVYVLALALS